MVLEPAGRRARDGAPPFFTMTDDEADAFNAKLLILEAEYGNRDRAALTACAMDPHGAAAFIRAQDMELARLRGQRQVADMDEI